jgi:DDE superfamily endonuclease/Helix-turn-helix of DDE superfamily endonuclease
MIMIHITRCFQDIRLFKAVTGMTSAEFTALLPAFVDVLQQAKTADMRLRQEGGGRKHTLLTGREKLFFIVFYGKCYATFDVLAWLFNVDRAQTHRWVTAYLPVLEAALGRKAVLPERKIASVEEFLRRFPQVKEVVVDGTERPIRRPTGKERQKPYYSGKKKGHCVKNIVVTAPTKRMLILSHTFPGHTHDKTGANEQTIFAPIPTDVQVHIDLGFLGVPTEHPDGTFSLPEKKPKGRALSEEAKTRTREKARRRVLVEHALGGVKRFRSVTDVLRNSLRVFADRLMLIACGLWNLHVEMAA